MRVEKMATTLKDNGHSNIFLGPQSNQYLGVFEEVHAIKLGRYVNLTMDPILDRRWKRKIENLKPEVVIAHDIVAAKFLLGTDHAVVYDDREFWSLSLQTGAGLKPTPSYKIQSSPFRKMVPYWEKKLLTRYPSLVTHEAVAKHHRRYGNWVGVAWNFPLLKMVDGLDNGGKREGAVYSGCDFRSRSFKTHRDMTGLRDVIEFDVICGVSHREMMQRLTRYKVGLTPWHPHPVLSFKDQNRNYEYLHAGLQVIVNEQIAPRFKECPYVQSFSDYSSLKEMLANIKDQDPNEISEYAKANYLWDFNELVILESVKVAKPYTG
jgi:hypothetical protein